MSNSKLVSYTRLSPNHSGKRKEKISKIAIHHTAGVVSVETLGSIFAPTSRQASCQYGIGSDGRVGLYVDEANRAWTTASSWCDNRAVTIEVSNSKYGHPWPVDPKVLHKLIELVTDICRRNNIYPCTYTGDKNGVLQKHEWYANTTCPGPSLGAQFSYIADEVNKRLRPSTTAAEGGLYKVQVGAYRDKSNAEKKAEALRKQGHEVYIVNEGEKNVNKPALKSLSVIAKEVIDGKWGNGQVRKDSLKKAGYNPEKVQTEVNRILGGK